MSADHGLTKFAATLIVVASKNWNGGAGSPLRLCAKSVGDSRLTHDRMFGSSRARSTSMLQEEAEPADPTRSAYLHPERSAAATTVRGTIPNEHAGACRVT